MKAVAFLILFFVCMLLNPLYLYSAYYLENNDKGIVFNFFRVVYTPEDYRYSIFEVLLDDGDSVSVDLNHKYKGVYNVVMYGEQVKNKDNNFNIKITCEDIDVVFMQSNQKHTDLFRDSNNKMIVGSYRVGQESIMNKKCDISVDLEGVSQPFFLKIEIGNHL